MIECIAFAFAFQGRKDRNRGPVWLDGALIRKRGAQGEFIMCRTLAVATIAILTSFSGAYGQCPVDDSNSDNIRRAIGSSESCHEAATIAESCAYGSSIDVVFAGDAVDVCERDFTHISMPQRETYQALVSQCRTKYEKEEGTMYRSAAAFCALQIARAFSSAYRPLR